MGLQGMINDLVQRSDYPIGDKLNDELAHIEDKNPTAIARLISAAENFPEIAKPAFDAIHKKNETNKIPVLGITGTGGAGKSSLVDELVRRFLIDFPEKTIGLISVDPSKRKTGGALLGDRIRMNAINNSRVYMRSLATRQSNLALSKYVNEAIEVLKAAKYDIIILETSGIGQSDTEIMDHSDVSLYVMTPEFGAATQLEKIDMLDFADLVALNKFDKRGALDAIRDVKKQYQRNHNLWDADVDTMPIFGTIASQFNDPGMNTLYKSIMDKIVEKTGADLKSTFQITREMSEKIFVIPPHYCGLAAPIFYERVRIIHFTHDTVCALRQSPALQHLLPRLELALQQGFITLRQGALDNGLAPSLGLVERPIRPRPVAAKP